MPAPLPLISPGEIEDTGDSTAEAVGDLTFDDTRLMSLTVPLAVETDVVRGDHFFELFPRLIEPEAGIGQRAGERCIERRPVTDNTDSRTGQALRYPVDGAVGKIADGAVDAV